MKCIKNFVIILAISAVHFCSLAQELKVFINPVFNSQSLDLSAEFEVKEHCIKTFKCYLTSFELLKDNRIVWTEENSNHLVDASLPESKLLNLNVPKDLQYNQISFLVGVDSLTSVSGAFGGDLDPTKGMYWAWNSGYVNLKLEGFHPNSSSPNNEFEFHLGGYLPPFQTVQRVCLSCAMNSPLEINIDLDTFIKSIDLEAISKIMSPGEKAKEMSIIAAKYFSCKYEK
jgi:hypothetical protein